MLLFPLLPPERSSLAGILGGKNVGTPLLAAVQQTGLLTSLETALSPSLLTADPSLRLAHSQPATLRSQLLTLLFLEAVGLQRTWNLRGYTGQALALLTGRHQALGYRLAELAKTGADDALTQALASWTASLWKPQARVGDGPVPVFYVDGHRKAVYADQPLSTRLGGTARESPGLPCSGGVA